MSRLTSRTVQQTDVDLLFPDNPLSSGNSGLGSLQSSKTPEGDVDSSELDLAIADADLSVDPQMVDFISDYFQEFTNSLGLEASDGSGLENLAGNPYVLSTSVSIPDPTPAPTSVPESSSVEGVLMLAACFGVGVVLKHLRCGTVRSR